MESVMSKFKDIMNRWRTLSLFQETAPQPKENVLFTFEEARQLYLECNDPTGYLFATKYLGGWKHYEILKASQQVLERIEEWEWELEVKLRAEAVSHMITLSQGDKGYQANKFLVDGGWIQKKAGRPTKEQTKKAIKQHLTEYSSLEGSVDLKH